jgi:transposase InsO family protein
VLFFPPKSLVWRGQSVRAATHPRDQQYAASSIPDSRYRIIIVPPTGGVNAVDQVTQWEIVAATSQISELWLLPVLEALLGQFPFVIRGFHSDNGSEFINYNVARLLDKLLIEQTKSRAHHSGDNGLA